MTFDEGDVVYYQGDDTSSFYMVFSGSVALHARPDGQLPLRTALPQPEPPKSHGPATAKSQRAVSNGQKQSANNPKQTPYPLLASRLGMLRRASSNKPSLAVSARFASAFNMGKDIDIHRYGDRKRVCRCGETLTEAVHVRSRVETMTAVCREHSTQLLQFTPSAAATIFSMVTPSSDLGNFDALSTAERKAALRKLPFCRLLSDAMMETLATLGTFTRVEPDKAPRNSFSQQHRYSSAASTIIICSGLWSGPGVIVAVTLGTVTQDIGQRGMGLVHCKAQLPSV